MQLERGEVIDTFNVWVDKSRLVFVASSVFFLLIDLLIVVLFLSLRCLSLHSGYRFESHTQKHAARRRERRGKT